MPPSVGRRLNQHTAPAPDTSPRGAVASFVALPPQRYECERDTRRRAGDYRGLVSAQEARDHILALGKKGIGYRSVAAAASVARSIVAQIRSGKRTQIRASTRNAIVVLAKSDLIDKLEVVLFHSIPLRTPLVRSFDRTFRLVSEPCGAPARDPRAPPSTRRSSPFRQATETDPGGSIALGLAMRRLERLAIQRLHRQGFDCHRLASERLSPVLGLEDPTG